ncbi:unnamed protein product [Sphagnum jensenii]|uniref:Uncharacterized protein n=1 Tax=Sphagnum jensenii TaxID=128206 RepID=A0ABP1BIS7_9BRYO
MHFWMSCWRMFGRVSPVDEMDGIGILSGIGYHGIGREQSVTLNSSLGEIFHVFSNTWGFHRVGVYSFCTRQFKTVVQFQYCLKVTSQINIAFEKFNVLYTQH